MLPLGLSAHQRQLFHRALRESHTVVPTVQVMNMDRKRLADVSLRLIDGSVNVTNDADTTRGCSLSLYDPNGAIALDSNDPSDGAMYLDNAVKVILSYHSPTFPASMGWVNVPVFCGPVTSVNRDADTLAVEAQGWEARLRTAVWEPKSWWIQYTTDMIRWLLRLAGETRIDVPDLKILTTEEVSLHRSAQFWNHAQKLARSLDRQLFYDGRGVARLRRLPSNRVWTFRDGDAGDMTTKPRVSFDLENARNIVWVRGRKPKGATERVNGWARLPAGNPLSPQRLGRNGRPAYLLETVDNDHIKTNRDAHELAVKLVNERARQAVSVEFDAMPVPHLDPGDLVRVDSGYWMQDFRIYRYSIPIGVGDSMSVGYTRRMLKGRKARSRPIQPMYLSTWGEATIG